MYYFNRLILLLFLLIYSINVCAISIQRKSKNLSQKAIEEDISEMANRCWNLRERNLDSAILIGKEALDLALEFKVKHEIPRICNFLGVLYLHYLPDDKTAIPYFHQALEGGLKANDSVQIAYAYNNLGDAFMYTGNLALAFQYAEASVQIFKKLKHKSGIAYGYINLALVYREEGNYEKALNYFNKVKEMREAADDKNGVASVLREIAIVYQKDGQLDKAEEFFIKSYQFHLSIDNIRYAAYCLSGMADNFYLQKQFDKAFDYYMQAIKLNDNRKFLYGQIDNYIGLAFVYAEQDKKNEGVIALSKALKISRSIYKPSDILKIYKAYGTFYQILEDYKEAVQSLTQFLVLSDSILSTQQFDILNEIQTNFLINQSLNLTQQELEAHKLEELYLFIIILLMLFVVIVFIWRLAAQRNMNRQLKLVNKSKDKLFSVITHDLKTPFNSLLGFTDILKENLENDDYENAKKYASIVNHSAEESLKLLNNLLNWSCSQTGRIKYKPEYISIVELFDDLNNLFGDNAQRFNIKLDFKTSFIEKIYADPNLLKIILSNLISNALKYTKQDGLIQLNAWKKNTSVFIIVKDNGIGMSDETLNNLFGSSESLSTPGIRNEKGSGLGLLLCSELIQLQKGRILAKSELGKGSMFEIEIPKY